ncbi:MAG: ABC transporter ATP-binding protein [Candidatus Marinimicrobia bacterium]|nr:ABC transporter ATP-binding protein [Candidatus Neomarinimicrobiota bacterium]
MIKMTDLTFAYKNKPPLFSGLSLQISDGNIYGLLGKNGAGKTTLLKIICGLLFPQQGTCSVLAFTPSKRVPEMLQEIYFIPEEIYTPPLKIDEYLKLYAPFYPRFDHQSFGQYIKTFDLPRNDRLTSLSYGQKKKFLVAFGLATNCRLLILDEPTNGLDIPSKSQFRKLLAASLSEDRIIIISTHQVRDIGNLIDPIVILDDGNVIFNQSIDDISRKLAVRLQKTEPGKDDVLYSEKTLGGYVVIAENRGELESNLDIELLFNAVINNQQRMGELFTREA